MKFPPAWIGVRENLQNMSLGEERGQQMKKRRAVLERVLEVK